MQGRAKSGQRGGAQLTAAGDELYEGVAAGAICRVCRRPRVEHVLDLELQVVLKLRVKRLLILALVADRLVLGELPSVWVAPVAVWGV